jgi:hypothetical protein
VSNESFSVGEIAELVYSRYHRDISGIEALVIGPLEYRFNMISGLAEHSYAIECEGLKYLALPDQLRKKRPPQDWKTLCNLEARELETA